MEFVQSLLQAGKKHLAQQFSFNYRCIDDVLSLKNTNFGEYLEFIYDFNFPIVNFLFLSSNIPSALAYGVYVSQLIRNQEPVQMIRTSCSGGKCLLQGC